MLQFVPFKLPENDMFETFGWTIACLTIAAYLLRHTVWYWLVFGIGCLASIIGTGYLAAIQDSKGPKNSRYVRKRFNFVNSNIWSVQVQALSLSIENTPIFPDALQISSTVDEMISLIIKSFISSWFSQISSSSLFENDIKLELQSTIRNLNDRLQKIDLSNLLVTKLLPILHDHFNSYIRAVDSVAKGVPDYHAAVARQFNKGKIHQGVTTSNSDLNFKEKKYFRSKVSKFLPLLLSSNENTSAVSLSLVSEILSCTILTSVFQMIGEADFYNVLITKLIGDNLKHRDQVKQLIAALEEHTSSQQQINLQPYTITEQIDGATLRKLISTIRRLEVDELKQVERYILGQVKPNNSPSVAKRLHILKETVNEQLIQLSLREKSSLEALNLSDILNNDSTTKLFCEFLDTRQRVEYLEFWMAVDKLRAPLEEDENEEEGDLNLSLEFSDVEDIADIYNKYCNLAILELDPRAAELIARLATKTYVPSEKPLVYQRARKALFKLQRETYTLMNESDFPQFKKSDIFAKFVNLDSLTAKQPMFSSPQQDEKNTVISPEVLKAVESAFNQIMSSTEPEKVFENDDEQSEDENEKDYDDQEDLQNLSTINMKKNLFGETSSLFGSDNITATGRPSRLFDDASDDSTDNESLDDSLLLANSEEDISQNALVDSQLFMAAPGNLSLAEEINKLNKEIDKLNEQLQILQPLIKKAELTNNITELKILKKSRISLDREINSKNMQRQQYTVQENDNSLFGKSRVSIQSYISGNEGGREFMLYIVEVQKLGPDDVVSAGWIVARRFSQFFKLHEYLRAKYPAQVGPLPFPKRTTMTVLKYQQRQLVEARKTALEEYLRQLIKIPEVCSNKAFRSFLSSENFNLRKNQPFEEKLGVVIRPRNNIEMVANKLYNGISSSWNTASGTPSSGGERVTNRTVDLENLKDMQQELKQFDEMGAPTKVLFVKPICDLLISVFGLNGSKSWIRGRALIVILQQVFGTTIEKKIGEQIQLHLRSQESLFKMINGLKNILFPNGKFKDPPVIRTLSEQAGTRQEAKLLLEMFMDETCSKVFGHSNTRYATTKVFGMIQNEYLNKHLLFEMLDEVLDEVFPEIRV